MQAQKLKPTQVGVNKTLQNIFSNTSLTSTHTVSPQNLQSNIDAHKIGHSPTIQKRVISQFTPQLRPQEKMTLKEKRQ